MILHEKEAMYPVVSRSRSFVSSSPLVVRLPGATSEGTGGDPNELRKRRSLRHGIDHHTNEVNRAHGNVPRAGDGEYSVPPLLSSGVQNSSGHLAFPRGRV